MVNSHHKVDRSSNENASSMDECMPRDVLTNAELYLEFTDRVLGRPGLSLVLTE